MKKILTMVLAAAMVLVLIPATALAADTVYVSSSAELVSAISSASNGDIIYLYDGTYELGQTVIGVDVTITGESRSGVTLIPTEDTSDYSRTDIDDMGWMRIDSGAAVNINNLTMDGSGHNICEALTVYGTLNVENVYINHIKYRQYFGFGIGVYYDGTLNVKDVVMSDIERIGLLAKSDMTVDGYHYTGKGAGDYLDYGIYAGAIDENTAAFSIDISNVTITDCLGVDSGWGSGGIYITSYFYSRNGGTEMLIDTDIEYASVNNCQVGIIVGYSDAYPEHSDTYLTKSNFSGNQYDFTFDDDSDGNGIFTVEDNYYGGNAPIVTGSSIEGITGIENYSTTPISMYQEADVTATADVSYMVVIPSSVDFGTIYKSMDAQSRQFIVAVEDALIEDGSSISVENTTAAMTMKDKDGAGSEELAFTLAQDEAPDNGVFMFAQTDLIDGTESIGSSVGCIPANLTAAGSYKGYMMFEVSYNTAD